MKFSNFPVILMAAMCAACIPQSFSDQEINPAEVSGPLELPIQPYLVQGAEFSEAQIRHLFERTNRKLKPAQIQLIPLPTLVIEDPTLAEVSYNNLPQILSHGANLGIIRLFLVRKDLDFNHGSWTYDPVTDPDLPPEWEHAIFLIDAFAESTNQNYQKLGFLPSNDSLLHELGHVLMRQSQHTSGPAFNFFHEQAEQEDDSMTSIQIRKMRQSPLLRRPADAQ